MGIRSLNGLDSNTTNVYINTNLSATEPVVVNQTSYNNPITVSLKGLSGFTANKIIKVNSAGTALEYADNNDYWTLSSNNLYPNSTSDRVIIGDTSSFNSSTGLTIKGSSNGFYTTGILDINRTAGNRIYLACDKTNSNDIYFGSTNSDNQGTNDGILLRNTTDNSDNHTFKINSVDNGSNTDRINISMPVSNDTTLSIVSSTNAYLELKENSTNYVDLRYEVGASNDSFKNVFYHSDGNQSIFNYNHSPTLSSRELIFYPKTEFDSDVLLNHTGGVSTQSKLIFSNDTNSNTYSFEYSENTENFSFKKNSDVLWDYDSSNSPAEFTMGALFKFNETTFRNSTNQTITLPTSTGTLALISDITAANYWSLSSNDLKTASTSYNVILGKATPTTGNPKLDVLGNAVIDGDITMTGTLQVEDHFAVNHSNPYTYIYDPTGYSTSNPYLLYHTNGTSLDFNIPAGSGSGSNFKWTSQNSAELMRLDADRTLKIFGTSSAKLELSNDDGLGSTSSIHFTNDVDGQKYFMEFTPSSSSDNFNFKYDSGAAETGLLNYNTSTERLTIGKTVVIDTEDSGNTNLFLTCGTTTGNGSIIVFGDSSDEDRYTFGYEKTASGGRLAITDAAGTPQITYDSSVSELDIGSTTLKTSGVIKNGSLVFTLPSSTGTLALTSQLTSGVFTTSGTTMTADPQANSSNVCSEFKISTGSGSNGDCALIIEADTDNTVASSNPSIFLKQDGGNVVGTIELQETGNTFRLSNGYSGANLDMATNGGTIRLLSDVSTNGDFDLTSDSKNINFQNYGSGGSQSYMNKLRFNDNDDCYISGQYETNSNAVGNDIVVKMSGGDMRLFRGNTPNSNASNYDSLLFINPSQTIYLYGGPDATYIFLSSTAFDGNRSYSGGTSDDRLKHNEELITNATETLMKLRPQIYMKDTALPQRRNRKNPNIIEDNENITQELEAGLIAQEVYYEAPELRHLVITRVENEDDIQELPDGTDLNDIQNDPDYVALGWNQYEPANVKYMELIPYLIKMNQEQQEQINTYKQIIDKLIKAPSFKAFKESLV